MVASEEDSNLDSALLWALPGEVSIVATGEALPDILGWSGLAEPYSLAPFVYIKLGGPHRVSIPGCQQKELMGSTSGLYRLKDAGDASTTLLGTGWELRMLRRSLSDFVMYHTPVNIAIVKTFQLYV